MILAVTPAGARLSYYDPIQALRFPLPGASVTLHSKMIFLNDKRLKLRPIFPSFSKGGQG
jgi:hypothetical protein